jgi:ATP-dependent helicase/nuclease subunit A
MTSRPNGNPVSPSIDQAIALATTIQRQAANPAPSVALRASAGSGKTKVLVDRFLRLCIEGGRPAAHPRSILAITFTRKAAVEIQKRLLERAAEMALADPETLAAELEKLFGDRPDPRPKPAELSRAAGLYEQVLEDVSGLNVGTIHSFCQLILNRFAVEAGLDPRFSVVEDRQELLDETLDQLELEMAARPELALAGRAVADNPASIRNRVGGFFHEQMRIQRWLDRTAVAANAGENEFDEMVDRAPRTDLLPLVLRELRAFLLPDIDSDTEPEPKDLWPALNGALTTFATTGMVVIRQALGADGETLLAKDLEKLRIGAETLLDPEQMPQENLAAGAAALFLTKADQVRSFTRMRKDPALKEIFNEQVAVQALPVLDVLRRIKYLGLYEKNRGLLQLGLRALDMYDELKRRDRVVDFQDLEELARRLMGDEARAMSLLYRLDDSIAHILLDEFQDTNFNQWEILQPFVDEFLAGGSGEGQPTVFFVGDVKQSIYEFRGAEPSLFGTVEKRLSDREGHRVLNLPTNFRSLSALVDSVGGLFTQHPLVASIDPAEREHLRQLWARGEATGQVVALPPFADDDDGDDDACGGDQRAAEAAARIVRHLVDNGESTWTGFGKNAAPRPLVWSDFLVLCRTRTEIGQYEKAFRQAGIPIAPSGRGMLAASREVQDILALLRWLVFPADDVALATVLRSPLFRIGEKDFQGLLVRRGLENRDAEGALIPPKGLWRTLSKEPDHPVSGEAVTLLAQWRKHLGFVSCHGLLRRIYREGQVLERFGTALGDQACYNLLRLFDLSLGPELAGFPTVRRLAGLIERADRRGGQDEGSLPRGGDQGRVRFMTVHGAKGLEEPVVLLVDADRPVDKEGSRVRTHPGDPNSPVLFGVNKEFRQPYGLPGGLELPEDGLQKASRTARERGRREETNLLYVALTRARDRLFVLGGDKDRTGKSGSEFDSPLRWIRRAAAAGPCPEVELAKPDWLPEEAPATEPTGTEFREIVAAHTADTRTWQPPVMRAALEEVAPSSAESPEVSAGPPIADAAAAIPGALRGEEVHALLQLAADQGTMPPGDGPLHEEAAAIFSDPKLSWIFRPEAEGARGLSEVPVVHRRKREPGKVPQQVTGVIDRLVLSPGRVNIVDYKTNRTGGDPQRQAEWVAHYRPQLAIYHEAISALVPDSEVKTWLVFTDPELDPSLRLVEC